MSHLCFFCPLDGIFAENLIIRAQKAINDNHQIKVEFCYHLILEKGIDPELFLNEDNLTKIEWLLSVSPFGEKIRKETIFDVEESILEIGPRLSMKTSFCTNALAVLNAVEIRNVSRIERSIRYLLHKSVAKRIPHQRLLELLGDRMTECIYEGKPNFEQTAIKEPFTEIRLLSNPNALKEANEKLGLAFDSSDLDYYKDLFINKLKRNPTDVELFDLAQSDSEHSRHWFFRGKLFIDGELRGESLMDSIRGTQKFSNQNNLIAFSDNSSVIKGFEKVPLMLPNDPTIASELSISTRSRHLLYTAETHNFPTAVCPFQGATTGTGGRIRDVHATGRGAHEIAAVAGYSFGNLHLPGYEMPWEEPEVYPSGFAHPRQICIEASDGASDYGNKFGEPVLCGFARSFGQRLPSGERCEYLKPIMFSGGIGSIDEEYLKKKGADAGQLLAKIGGPVYRIGVGGGAASSQAVQGDRESVLDFGAVQRGDAEMEQKVHRVVRSCVEMNSADNPILSIHDQGAGGNGNVLKELCEGAGGEIFADFFELGDHTISIRELWTAEYQENDAILLDPTKKEIIEKISKREKCPVNIVGKVTGNQKVILHDFSNSATQKLPVDFDLSILSDREKKEFHQNSLPILTSPLKIVDSLTISSALGLVLRLPSVASKRYLTTKVDRSVTGLVARQQCCGPLHTPLADVAVVALSYFSLVGGAFAVGEQPLCGLISPAAMARRTLAETLTNLVFAPITCIKDIKLSGNWMWAAKCEGEGARLVEACDALCVSLRECGIAIDGGKDSLSMAVRVKGELVKSPGTLVLSAYAPCEDITKVISPDFKADKKNSIIYIRINPIEENRLGGSALAQCLKQIGDRASDVESFEKLILLFETVQKMIVSRKVLAGHDISDGGFITALLEMAFAGNVGVDLNFQLPKKINLLEFLFAEEVGLLLEIQEEAVDYICKEFSSHGLISIPIGRVVPEYGPKANVKVTINDELLIDDSLCSLREIWEETSDRLNRLQTNNQCIEEEIEGRKMVERWDCRADFDFSAISIPNDEQHFTSAPRVGVLREEGSNGDREMAAAFYLAGFSPYDITMTDLLNGFNLDTFRGLAFVGGFSYADVLGSAKGWAASIAHHPALLSQFEHFRSREDTFSFGVCNGCQLMALLGWIGEYENKPSVFLDVNRCGRFHSNWVHVKIRESRAIMLNGMHEATLGIWSVHGEGRFTYRKADVLEKLEERGQIAVQYVNPRGEPTERFPWNPNGSEKGVAAICSENGRHLAMMPHSDRSFMAWQWPDREPQIFRNLDETSLQLTAPWLKMFQNAYNWCKN